MPTDPPVIRSISDTSRWTAAIRALESERPDAVFHDPYARRLAGPRGFAIVDAIRNPAIRIGVVLRTAAIDEVVGDAVRSGRCDAVLSLAAGLDARPWRMDLPADLTWIEVDLAEVLDYKESVLAGETPRCAYEAVTLDLADAKARRVLFDATGARFGHVLVLTEGLLSYLEREDVASLAEDLHAVPSLAEWVFDLPGGQLSRRVRTAGDRHRPEDAKTRFVPAEGTAFFTPYGWAEGGYVDLFLEAGRLGRDSVLGRALRGVFRVLPAGARRGLERGLGVVTLVRADAAPSA